MVMAVVMAVAVRGEGKEAAMVVATVVVMVAAEVVVTGVVTAVTAGMVGAAGAAHRAPSLLRTKGCHLCTPDWSR